MPANPTGQSSAAFKCQTNESEGRAVELLTTARLIHQAASEDAVFTCLEGCLRKLNLDSALFDAIPDALRLVSIHDSLENSSGFDERGISVPVEGSPEIFTGKSYFILDTSGSHEAAYTSLLKFFRDRSWSTLLVLPINFGDTTVRILAIEAAGWEKPVEGEIRPFSELCAVCSEALNRLSQVRSLKTRLDTYETLASVSLSISNEFDLERLYQLVHQKISGRLGADLSFIIAIYEAVSQTIQIPYLYENGEISTIDSFPLGEGLTSILINTQKSLLLNKNTEQEARRLGAKIVGKPAKSWMGVPLLFSGEVVGAIILQDTVHEERFTEKDLNLVETLAPQVAIAIRNARLVDDLSSTLAAFNQESTLLTALLDNVPEKIYFKDRDGLYLRVSAFFAREMGFDDPSEIIGKSDAELMVTEAGTVRHFEDLAIMSNGLPLVGQLLEHTDKHNRKTWDLVSRVPLMDRQGQPLGLLCISQDISGLKQAEETSARQARYLHTAAEIARDVTASLNAPEIMQKATQLIRDRFGYYHATVFLIDPSGKKAVLSEATGEVGLMLKAKGHQLAVGSQSLVGQATFRMETVVVNRVHDSPDYYPNPLLPETQAELVVPLKTGSRILGALDVQANHEDAFSEEDVRTLEILADQLAVTLENARLYSKTQENLIKHRLLHMITSSASSSADIRSAVETTTAQLRQTLKNVSASIYLVEGDEELKLAAFAGEMTSPKAETILDFENSIINTVVANQKSIRIDRNPQANLATNSIFNLPAQLAVPIHFSGKFLGVLHLASPTPGCFDENDEEIMALLGSALGAVITNLRLLEQIRQKIERQRQLLEITNKIRQTVDIETILRISSAEIARLAKARKARIRVAVDENPHSQRIDSGQLKMARSAPPGPNPEGEIEVAG